MRKSTFKRTYAKEFGLMVFMAAAKRKISVRFSIEKEL
jgi:hypothetical protein